MLGDELDEKLADLGVLRLSAEASASVRLTSEMRMTSGLMFPNVCWVLGCSQRSPAATSETPASATSSKIELRVLQDRQCHFRAEVFEHYLVGDSGVRRAGTAYAIATIRALLHRANEEVG